MTWINHITKGKVKPLPKLNLRFRDAWNEVSFLTPTADFQTRLTAAVIFFVLDGCFLAGLGFAFSQVETVTHLERMLFNSFVVLGFISLGCLTVGLVLGFLDSFEFDLDPEPIFSKPEPVCGACAQPLPEVLPQPQSAPAGGCPEPLIVSSVQHPDSMLNNSTDVIGLRNSKNIELERQIESDHQDRVRKIYEDQTGAILSAMEAAT